MQFPTRVSTVLFDAGNTLGHLDLGLIAELTSRFWRPVGRARVALAEYAAKAAVDRWFRARAGGDDSTRLAGYFESILDALGVPTEPARQIVGALHEENKRESLWRVVPADAAAMLGELRRRGFVLGVVSNADGRVAASLESFGLARHFEVIIDSHLVGVEKPEPRIFELALQACRAKAAETVFVGDLYEIDVQGARRAGIAAVLLDPLLRYDPVDCPRIERLSALLDLLPERASDGGGELRSAPCGHGR